MSQKNMTAGGISAKDGQSVHLEEKDLEEKRECSCHQEPGFVKCCGGPCKKT